MCIANIGGCRNRRTRRPQVVDKFLGNWLGKMIARKKNHPWDLLLKSSDLLQLGSIATKFPKSCDLLQVGTAYCLATSPWPLMKDNWFFKTTLIIIALSTVNQGTAGTVATLTQQIPWHPDGSLSALLSHIAVVKGART